ncbi:MAG TPA: DUF2891 domain-containing protein [Candidatus Eisenbacteria bacterium]|nr:DUF2891 domain-containing protein [Candidatus Eisenbacteria bacterium]
MSVDAGRSSSAARLADLILAAVGREYPSHIVHWMGSDADARPPRELTPAFFGSFDWHSCVHGHWALARLARFHAGEDFASRIRAALSRSLTAEKVAGECAYLGVPERAGFERPYGLAWLLQLAAELREWRDPEAQAWSAALSPLEELVRERLAAWLPTLPWPVRSGVHPQTALSLSLTLDWSRTVNDGKMEALIERRALDWFRSDTAAPIAYEPSGNDFLSPALGEADLMRRLLPPVEFATWLEAFLPDLESDIARRWLTPVTSPDSSDGQLAHLDGLNLSRAWMLEGIASALPMSDLRRVRLDEAARAHAEAGLAAVSGEHYAGAHWLGSYAVYYLTRRGIVQQSR